MSATKFAEYGKEGFWAYDVALDIFLKYLVEVAEPYARKTKLEWLEKAINDWRVATLPDLGLDLDTNWTESQCSTFVELANRACHNLSGQQQFTVDEVNSWPPILEGYQIRPRGDKNIETAPVIELGKAMIALVEGTLPKAPDGTWWFFGTPEGRDTIRMRVSNTP